MKIAVIGAGIYGTTIAIKLADSGFSVDLFEKEKDILQAASRVNQCRLHRGYHYPRSPETGASSRKANPVFYKEYNEAIIKDNKHYYCIAKEESKISGKNFLKVCDESKLKYKHLKLPFVDEKAFDLTIKANEHLFDTLKLKDIVKRKIRERKINLKLGRKFISKDIAGYETVINCTYANLNSILDRVKDKKKYQFELCEKPVLKLPDKFKGVSLVVMDGPFFCIDPYGDTDFHLMGNVVHAIHATNIGFLPNIPKRFIPLLNKGIVKNIQVTSTDGRTIRFPASKLRPYLTHSGISGEFTMRFDRNNKFVELIKIVI